MTDVILELNNIIKREKTFIEMVMAEKEKNFHYYFKNIQKMNAGRKLIENTEHAILILKNLESLTNNLPSEVRFRLQKIALADDEMIKGKNAANVYRDIVRSILEDFPDKKTGR